MSRVSFCWIPIFLLLIQSSHQFAMGMYYIYTTIKPSEQNEKIPCTHTHTDKHSGIYKTSHTYTRARARTTARRCMNERERFVLMFFNCYSSGTDRNDSFKHQNDKVLNSVHLALRGVLFCLYSPLWHYFFCVLCARNTSSIAFWWALCIMDSWVFNTNSVSDSICWCFLFACIQIFVLRSQQK